MEEGLPMLPTTSEVRRGGDSRHFGTSSSSNNNSKYKNDNDDNRNARSDHKSSAMGIVRKWWQGIHTIVRMGGGEGGEGGRKRRRTLRRRTCAGLILIILIFVITISISRQSAEEHGDVNAHKKPQDDVNSHTLPPRGWSVSPILSEELRNSYGNNGDSVSADDDDDNNKKERSALKYNVASYILNGHRDGSVNTKRWPRAKQVCEFVSDTMNHNDNNKDEDNLPPKCVRVNSVYCDTKDFVRTCNGLDCTKLDADKRKALGCMHAHLNALYLFLQSPRWITHALVFEDDVILPALPDNETRNRLKAIARDQRAKDLVQLGHCYGGVCTTALQWSRRGAWIAVEKLARCHTWWPIDQQLKEFCEWTDFNMTCYRATPNAPHRDGAWGDGLLHQKGHTLLSESAEQV